MVLSTAQEITYWLGLRAAFGLGLGNRQYRFIKYFKSAKSYENKVLDIV